MRLSIYRLMMPEPICYVSVGRTPAGKITSIELMLRWFEIELSL